MLDQMPSSKGHKNFKLKTNSECIRNCIFAVDGVCRLEHTHGLRQPECPFRDGSQAVTSVM